MAQKVEFKFNDGETFRFRVKENWDRANQEGEYFGTIWVSGTAWAIVVFDADTDPGVYKAAALLIQNTSWIALDA